MAAKNSSNGVVVMAGGDTFTAPTQNGEFQPQALVFTGATTVGTKAGFTDADGVTVCMLTVGVAKETVVLDKHFWGGIRPVHSPITAFASNGYLFLYI